MINDNELIALLEKLDAEYASRSQHGDLVGNIKAAIHYALLFLGNWPTLSTALRERLAEPSKDDKEVARLILVNEGLTGDLFPVVLAARLIDAIAAALKTARASSPSSLAGEIHACGDPDCIVPHPALHKRPPQRKSASSSLPLAGDKVEGRSELAAAYHAAVRAGLSSTEGRTFQEWRDRVSDYGLDDAQQALAIERERAK